ncbi:hypothetical protein [Paenibacillus antibioticophila]|uniref:hypothetical protein n=1 Tax=Paenibacillus antibioticophila TaxID=1274374 RepID=UPI0008FEF878
MKENYLVHREFGKWVKDSFDFINSMASNYIAAYDQFSELPTSVTISSSKILEMLSLSESIDRRTGTHCSLDRRIQDGR